MIQTIVCTSLSIKYFILLFGNNSVDQYCLVEKDVGKNQDHGLHPGDRTRDPNSSFQPSPATSGEKTVIHAGKIRQSGKSKREISQNEVFYRLPKKHDRPSPD